MQVSAQNFENEDNMTTKYSLQKTNEKKEDDIDLKIKWFPKNGGNEEDIC